MISQFKRGNNFCCRHIPAEILEEILVQLPVKSLNRFRSVSKSWQSLISSHRFIIKHHRIAESKLFQRTLIHHQHLNTLPFYIPDIPNLLPNSDHPETGRAFIGSPPSCHGLICIKNDDGAPSVWNPYMRMIKHIPNSSGIPNSTDICFGIGYDAVRDDYKIMKLCSWIGYDAVRDERTKTEIYSLKERTKTEIYSMKTGSWTTVDDFQIVDISLLFLDRCESVYLDGAIHWLARFNKSIISFDLSTNKYKRIPLPEYELIKGCISQQIRLAALRGMLYVLVNDTSGLMLWGLKEDYSDQSSWIRLVQIPWRVLSRGVISYPNYRFFKLLYVYENGEFLIGAVKGPATKTEMIICNESRIILRHTTPHSPKAILVGVVQVESLISRGLDAKFHPEN